MEKRLSRCSHARGARILAALASIGVAASLLPTAPTQAQGFGTAFFAGAISTTGTVTRSLGITSAKRTTTGSFQVVFSRPLSACYFSVSVIGAGPSFANGTISTNDPTLLFVRTYNGAGTAVNAPFNVVVVCGS